MTLQVFSARLSYGGPDRFDITRKSGGVAGAPFAPSWAILKPALDALKRAGEIRTVGLARPSKTSAAFADADAIELKTWQTYHAAFLREMRASYRERRPAWTELLRRERVVLVCFCVLPERCHRSILRSEILPSLGAVDAGELLGDAYTREARS